jgi:hypothetical protein
MTHTGVKTCAYALIIVLLMLAAALCVAAAARVRGRGSRGGFRRRPDFIKLNPECPPPAPSPKVLSQINVGRIRGAQTVPTSYQTSPSACHATCGKGCVGWGFYKSSPDPAGGKTYACHTYTVDDQTIIYTPPVVEGDYVSESLSCAARSGPGSITGPIADAAAYGNIPFKTTAPHDGPTCLASCAAHPRCIGATFDGAKCYMYDTTKGLFLATIPGMGFVSSGSFFAGDHAIPFDPVPLS